MKNPKSKMGLRLDSELGRRSMDPQSGDCAKMAPEDAAIEALLHGVKQGDRDACDRLLGMHRERLKRMVAVRMDRRLAPRVDPSDIVQDALAEANLHLGDYARDRPIPFYPWLRRLVWERMVAMTRRHIGSSKRSVIREEPKTMKLPDESASDLVGLLVASGTSPSGRLSREELRDRVQASLLSLEPDDCEVLILRYLEQLTTKETAAVLGLSESGVKSRLMRALIRLRGKLDGLNKAPQKNMNDDAKASPPSSPPLGKGGLGGSAAPCG
jgi:RNA polymerase sigma-70 factor, ECF subfamily